MSEREQLERAIAALEAQRAALGDEVVDPAIAALHQQLDALLPQGGPDQQRKLVTVLFADVVDSTHLTLGLDPEEVSEVMDGALQRLAAPVVEHGGQVTRFMGDGLMAVFGIPLAHEHDAEQAVRAGLGILETARAYAAELQATRQLPGFDVRVGVNSGPALIGGLSEGEHTVMGLTVNLGARMESAAPPGGLLISHYTYRHVRGLFDVQPLEPVAAKGFPEPVPVYLVERAKPHAFRLRTRGVEGVETRMVGRQAELTQLQEDYLLALEDGESQVVTVTGEAGVGKSRLLLEFLEWIELRPETNHLFQGRATEPTRDLPYGLLRDLLAERFHIQHSDPTAVARAKLVAGVTGYLGAGTEEQAHFIGHLAGLDFSDSPYLRGILSQGGQIRQRAFHYLTQFFRAVYRSGGGPIIVALEDIHWADDGSLDVVDHVGRHCLDVPLLVVCLARPVLYERRPLWGSGYAFHSRIHLELLTRRYSRRLADELLQRMEQPPQALRQLLIDQAEGNPFYMEELLKMLIDEGVISTEKKRWQVELPRLASVKVPPTLTGVLQARLDGLAAEERAALQWASVVGHVFWDDATAEVGRRETETEAVLAALARLAGRALIYGRERSAFAGTREYVFKQAMLHEITYESVLKRLRRAYHHQVAEWLVGHSGERAGEYAALIAEHYARAKEIEQAVAYLCRAAEGAFRTSAHREEQRLYERALALLPVDGTEGQRAALACKLGWTQIRLGDLPQATVTLGQALALARQAADEKTQAAALIALGDLHSRHGDYVRAQVHLEEALALARGRDDPEATAHALLRLGDVGWQRGEYTEATQRLEKALDLYTALGDRVGMAWVHGRLGIVATLEARYTQAVQHAQESLALARETGNRLNEDIALAVLGHSARRMGDLATARVRCEQGLEVAQEIADQVGAGLNTLILGLVALDEGDHGQAGGRLHEALARFTAIEALPYAVWTLVGVARLRGKMGDADGALALIGLAQAHPAANQLARDEAAPILAELEAALGPEAVAAGLERGQALDLNGIVEELLASGKGGA